MLAFESDYAPAGGAALDQVIGLSVAALLITILLGVVGWAHRTERINWIQKLGDWLTAKIGLPGWTILTAIVIAGSLAVALLGYLWDVSLHAGRGRDDGPLANPAHYLILIGLFGTFISGMVGIVFKRNGDKPARSAVRITRKWFAPVSSLFIAGSGLYALLGFPLDDVWHRLFGQDVTLWGPTHLMLIGGAGLATVGIVMMHAELTLSDDYDSTSTIGSWLLKATLAVSFGVMLVGLSVFQGEFDFGIAQFRMGFAPLMIALAGAFSLIAARIYAGAGAAIIAALTFLGIRWVVSFTVGDIFGEAHHWFPLYLGSAIVIELVALTPLLRNKLAFGAVAGLLVGTVGTATEKVWNDYFFPFEWARDMWVEGLIVTVPVAIAAGLCGALFAMGLQGDLPKPKISAGIVVASLLVLSAAVANLLWATVPENATVNITATQVETEIGPAIEIEVEVQPADLIDDEYTWVQLMAWQGGGPGVVSDNLERTGQNTWVSTQPIPIEGNWKTVLRVQDGRMLTAAPVYLPEDRAIDAAELPVEAEMTRPFMPEIELLQRERNFDAPSWLWGASNAVVLICSLIMVWGLSAGTARISNTMRQEAALASGGAPADAPKEESV